MHDQLDQHALHLPSGGTSAQRRHVLLPLSPRERRKRHLRVRAERPEGDVLMSLPDLAQAVRSSGLDVVELPGWRDRGRPGSFSPDGVLCHHTGGASDDRGYVDWMATVGRSDLPAPLCQLALDRKGTVYVLAAGRANHGGTARSTGPMPAGDANTMYIGIEAMNTGSEGWSDRQYDAYARLCAALCRHYGWPASHVRAHRETSVTGKWDPGLLDMDRFRTDIATLIEGDDVTPDDIKAIADAAGKSATRALLDHKIDLGDGKKRDVEQILKELWRSKNAPKR